MQLPAIHGPIEGAKHDSKGLKEVYLIRIEMRMRFIAITQKFNLDLF